MRSRYWLPSQRLLQLVQCSRSMSITGTCTTHQLQDMRSWPQELLCLEALWYWVPRVRNGANLVKPTGCALESIKRMEYVVVVERP